MICCSVVTSLDAAWTFSQQWLKLFFKRPQKDVRTKRVCLAFHRHRWFLVCFCCNGASVAMQSLRDLEDADGAKYDISVGRCRPSQVDGNNKPFFANTLKNELHPWCYNQNMLMKLTRTVLNLETWKHSFLACCLILLPWWLKL